jgi:homoserine dehydrogenase
VGRGAGGLETASAILRDLIEIRESISVPFDSMA